MRHFCSVLACAAFALLPYTLATPSAEAAPKPAIQESVGAKACIPGRPGCAPVKPARPPSNVYLHFWFGNYPPPYYYYPYYSPYQWHDHHDQPMSCRTARKRLSSVGFKSIKTLDCAGRYYAFTALRAGHKYRITMNAFTGRYNWSLVRR